MSEVSTPKAPPVSQALTKRSDNEVSSPNKDTKCLVSFLGDKQNPNESVNRDPLTPGRREKLDSGGNVDFLPTELLISLAKPAEKFENLGPGTANKVKRGSSQVKQHSKKAPDNAWNHPQSREKLKHLVEQPPCVCGAGRDISFLYDASSSPQKGSRNADTKSTETNQNIKRTPINKRRNENDSKDSPDTFDTIVPSEFHVVKNPGVLGLEIREGKYTTKTDDHQHHLTLFPSLKPAGRQEVIKLKHAMNAMLKRAGVSEDDENGDILPGSDAPTQIHELLKLVKEEQTVYNVIFNEIIRQVTVECVERGELLAELRGRYARLLDKVPRRVKSLHEEVLAQRALDRRLTEELTRFKSSISLLTKELNEVQAHDREVTQQAQETQEQLQTALKESEKNASLLSEYHELYELQRKRLEHQISSLIEERDLWSGGSYILALKVAQKHNLTTSKRLHLHEKAWHKLAGHFAILLNNHDSIQLQALNGHLQAWQDLTFKFNKKLSDAEKDTYHKLKEIQEKLKSWGQDFLRVVTPEESSVHVPNQQLILRLCEDVKTWEETLNAEAERFTGDALLSCEDALVNMNRLVDQWTEVAVQIFGRHQPKSGTMSEQHRSLLNMNKQTEVLHRQFQLRMTGENGLAKGFIHLINVYGTWVNKLNAIAKGSETLLDPEWVRLADFIQNEWPTAIAELISLVAPEDAEEDAAVSRMSLLSGSKEEMVVDLQQLRERAQKWIKDTTVWIENEDGSLMEKVTSCHSSMVRWMVTVLHRLAPDFEPPEKDFDDDTEEKESIGIGAAILAECTSEQICQKALLLFRLITSLSKVLHDSSLDVVVTKMQERKDAGDETAEFEYRDLKKIQVERDGWIRTANLLVHELTGEFLQKDENDEFGNAEERKEPLGSVSDDLSGIPTNDEGQENQEAGTKETEKPDSTDEGEHSPDGEAAITEIGPEDTKKNEDNNAEGIDKGTGENKEAAHADDQPASEERKTDASLIDEEKDDEKVREIHFIGHDQNVKKKSLDDIVLSQTEDVPKDNKVQRPLSSEAVENLSTIEKLQSQLLESETRAQSLEERAIDAEINLKEALEKVRALERAMSKSRTVSPAQNRPQSGTVS